MATENVKIDILVDASKSVKSIQEAKQALRDLKSAALEAQLAGDSIGFKKATDAAGQLSDKIGDLNKTVRGLGSDTAGIDALIGGVRGVAAGFAIAQGAVGLFGDKNKDLEKTLLKVQSTMAILNGIQEITNLVQKDSILVQKALAINGSILTGVFGKQTVALAAEAVAAGTATVAQRALNAAMNANPVILIITALATLTAGIFAFTKATENASKESEMQEKALSDLKDQINELNKAYVDLQYQMVLTGIENDVLTGKLTQSEAEIAKIRAKNTATGTELWKEYFKDVAKIIDNGNADISKRSSFFSKENAFKTAADLQLLRRLAKGEMGGYSIDQQKILESLADRLEKMQKLSNERYLEQQKESDNARLKQAYENQKAIDDIRFAQMKSADNALKIETAKELDLKHQRDIDEARRSAGTGPGGALWLSKKLLDIDADYKAQQRKQNEDNAKLDAQTNAKIQEQKIETALKFNKDDAKKLSDEAVKNKILSNDKIKDIEAKNAVDEAVIKSENDEKKRQIEKQQQEQELADQAAFYKEKMQRDQQHALSILELHQLQQTVDHEMTKDEAIKFENDRYKIAAQYSDDLEETTRDHQKRLLIIEKTYAQQRLESISNYTNQAMAIFSKLVELQGNLAEKEKIRIQEVADAQIKEIDRRQKAEEALTSTMSNEERARAAVQEEYDTERKAAQDQANMKIYQEAVKQFEFKQKLAHAQSLMDAASAGIKVAAEFPPPSPLFFVGEALVAAQAIASAIAIDSQVPPTPPTAAKGMLVGPSHAAGGIMINAEGGEAIINKRSSAAFRPLLSAINQAGGGVAFATGGFVGTPSSPEVDLSPLTNALGNMPTPTVKAYVVESEVTRSQKRVARLENRARY